MARILRGMRTEQLEYIAAVTRLGSLRRAAEELRLSQPALSETVRNLERELGVDLLERKRSGATMSAEGRELLPHIVGVLEAVDRLRGGGGRAAPHQPYGPGRHGERGDRAAAHPGGPRTSGPRIRSPRSRWSARSRRTSTGPCGGRVRPRPGQPPRRRRHARRIRVHELLRGRPVVCLRPDSPLAARPAVPVDDLLTQPLIAMRSGYVMHRFVHRLLGGRGPSFSYSTDGAEMGKLMVAEGLGVTVLPDFSVVGDPLERQRHDHPPADRGRHDPGAADASAPPGRVRAAGGPGPARGVRPPGPAPGRDAHPARLSRSEEERARSVLVARPGRPRGTRPTSDPSRRSRAHPWPVAPPRTPPPATIREELPQETAPTPSRP